MGCACRVALRSIAGTLQLPRLQWIRVPLHVIGLEGECTIGLEGSLVQEQIFPLRTEYMFFQLVSWTITWCAGVLR